jgi:hypothetical protein
MRKAALYCALLELDGVVPDQAAWRELGHACGYTAYGDLAGFFGGRVPSMVRMSDGSRVLTPAGRMRALVA